MVCKLYMVHSQEMGRSMEAIERAARVKDVDMQANGGQGVDEVVMVDWLVVVSFFVALVLDAQRVEVERYLCL